MLWERPLSSEILSNLKEAGPVDIKGENPMDTIQMPKKKRKRRFLILQRFITIEYYRNSMERAFHPTEKDTKNPEKGSHFFISDFLTEITG
jgi:hypothetical protein